MTPSLGAIAHVAGAASFEAQRAAADERARALIASRTEASESSADPALVARYLAARRGDVARPPSPEVPIEVDFLAERSRAADRRIHHPANPDVVSTFNHFLVDQFAPALH